MSMVGALYESLVFPGGFLPYEDCIDSLNEYLTMPLPVYRLLVSLTTYRIKSKHDVLTSFHDTSHLWSPFLHTLPLILQPATQNYLFPTSP